MLRLTLFAALSITCGAHASAQYASAFEALNASTNGTVLTGQEGFYLPAGTTSLDLRAYTYAGNGLNLPANPTGSVKFIGGTEVEATPARAQRDVTFGARVWTAGFEICARFTGPTPAGQSVGSFSLQPENSRSFAAIARWVDPGTATHWSASYSWYNAAGVPLGELVGDSRFQNLPANWFRWETDFDLTTNAIVEVRLTNLASGTTVTQNPIGRFLRGGNALGALPSAFRLAAGGGGHGRTRDRLSVMWRHV